MFGCLQNGFGGVSGGVWMVLSNFVGLGCSATYFFVSHLLKFLAPLFCGFPCPLARLGIHPSLSCVSFSVHTF